MNFSRVLFSSFTVAIMLSSCTKDNENLAQVKDVVQLRASVHSGNYTKVGDQWVGTEKVGLFMIGENDFSIVNNVDNKEYDVAIGGALTAADKNEAKYPADGSNVRFVAYYPYDKTLTGRVYKVDLRQEKDHDLLYVEATGNFTKVQESPVNLSFKHKLARLFLTVKKDNQIQEGVTAKITRKVTADFDLATGVLSNPAQVSELSMTAGGTGLTALVLPGVEADSKIVFASGEKQYTWDLSDKELTAGIQYNYTITLKDEEIPLVDAKLESTIEGWIPESGDVNIDQDKKPSVPETVYQTPVFSGTLTQNSAISGAKLTVNYSNGNGAQVSVTTLVGGVAANGVAVADKQVTLASGNGSFELPVSGTPSHSGKMTFTVSVAGKALSMIEATVAEQSQQQTPVYSSNLTTIPAGSVISIGGTTYPVVKLGASGSVGSWTSDLIGAAKTKLKFYASAWASKTGVLKISVLNGGLIDGETSKTINLESFVSGTTSPFGVVANRPASGDLRTYDLTGITAGTTIKFESLSGGSDMRAVLLGINVE